MHAKSSPRNSRRSKYGVSTSIIQRVVDLYEAWHVAEPGQRYDVKAAEWRAKLPQSPDGSAEGEEGNE